MKLFVTKKQLKYWQHIKYIEGYAKGTTTANAALAADLEDTAHLLRIHGALKLPQATHPIERER